MSIKCRNNTNLCHIFLVDVISLRLHICATFSRWICVCNALSMFYCRCLRREKRKKVSLYVWVPSSMPMVQTRNKIKINTPFWIGDSHEDCFWVVAHSTNSRTQHTLGIIFWFVKLRQCRLSLFTFVTFTLLKMIVSLVLIFIGRLLSCIRYGF